MLLLPATFCKNYLRIIRDFNSSGNAKKTEKYYINSLSAAVFFNQEFIIKDLLLFYQLFITKIDLLTVLFITIMIFNINLNYFQNRDFI